MEMRQLSNHVFYFLRLTLLGGIFALLLIPSGTNLYSHDDLTLVPDPLPVGQPDPPPDPPKEGVEINYGRCTVDYSEIEIADGYTLGEFFEYVQYEYGEDVAHLLGVEHHDVFLDPPVVPAKFSLIRPGTWGPPGEDKYLARGFYGQIWNVVGWRKQMRAWYNDREIVYTKGSMIDKVRKKEICTRWGNGNSRDVTNNASAVVLRYQEEWENFHLIERNCQHWAFTTLTGFDLNTFDPDDYLPEEE